MLASIVVISKDEEQLDETLNALEDHANFNSSRSDERHEIIVVDASDGRLNHIEKKHPAVRWIDFKAPDGVKVSIPHQRNVGIRSSSSEIIVFTDAGCIPQEGWLVNLIAPLADGSESVTCGGYAAGSQIYTPSYDLATPDYVIEAPSINLAFKRDVIERVGWFDEDFQYGSDMDFTWRVTRAGYKIRYVSNAEIVHDWGDFRRQLKRAKHYGAARARLYRKHPDQLRFAYLVRNDPVPIFALFLLGLPITLKFRWYPLLLAIPIYRSRRSSPLQLLICHFVEGYNFLRQGAILATASGNRIGSTHR